MIQFIPVRMRRQRKHLNHEMRKIPGREKEGRIRRGLELFQYNHTVKDCVPVSLEIMVFVYSMKTAVSVMILPPTCIISCQTLGKNACILVYMESAPMALNVGLETVILLRISKMSLTMRSIPKSLKNLQGLKI